MNQPPKRTSYLILGAGKQGVAAAYDAILYGNASRVTLADSSAPLVKAAVTRITKLLKAVLKNSHVLLKGRKMDCRKKETLPRLMKGHNAVLSALPHYLNPGIAESAIASEIHYCDLGGYFESTQKILKLDSKAKKAGVTLVPDCGVSPGMCNSLAACGISHLEKTTDVHIYCGGLPIIPRPPLGYKVVFSLEGVLGNYFGNAYVLKNGKIELVQSLSELEEIDFGEPFGKLEAVITGGATSTCPWTYEGKIQNYTYKTLRYPGHYEKIRTLKELGLLETEPVRVNGYKIIPRQVFVALAEPRLRFSNDRDCLVMKVIVKGEKDGKKIQIVYDVLEFEDPATGFSAMQRTTGFSAAVILEMLAQGLVRQKGVVPVEKAVSGSDFIEKIRKRGVAVHERTETEQAGLRK
jgi:lysine 6-dehydrogenase